MKLIIALPFLTAVLSLLTTQHASAFRSSAQIARHSKPSSSNILGDTDSSSVAIDDAATTVLPSQLKNEDLLTPDDHGLLTTLESNPMDPLQDDFLADDDNPTTTQQQSRLDFLRSTVAATMAISTLGPAPALGFEGGVGGLGKTKPQTGVQFFGENGPIQNEKGIVSAEIASVSNKPMLVSFQTPWPLLAGSGGLEARDLRNSESAFVQVVPLQKNWMDKKIFQDMLLNSVFASTGKYGAYGQPYNVQVKPVKAKEGESGSNVQQLFSVTFTSLTPAMRESERKVWVQSTAVDNDTLVMLVVGTTTARFPSNEDIIRKVVDSFEAVKAPESKLR